jgi:hypothetical protein
LRTSCWLLPQKLQYKVFLLSPPEFDAMITLSGFNVSLCANQREINWFDPT